MRVEKTVFLSYRRASFPWAVAIYQSLTQNGYDVFFDYKGIDSGDFELTILQNIRARAHFVVLLTPTALERCGDTDDWLRKEIEEAIDCRRNIIPLMLENFDFRARAILPQLIGRLGLLKSYNGLTVPSEYFDAAMEKLRDRFLSVPMEAVLHPASDHARRAAEEQKSAADNAPFVHEQNLLDKIRIAKLPADNSSWVESIAHPLDLYAVNTVDSASLRKALLTLYSKRGHVTLAVKDEGHGEDGLLWVQISRAAESAFPALEMDPWDWATDILVPEMEHFVGPVRVVGIDAECGIHEALYERISIDPVTLSEVDAKEAFERITIVHRKLMWIAPDWYKYDGFRALIYRLLQLSQESYLLAQIERFHADDRLTLGINYAMLHSYMAGLGMTDYSTNKYHNAEQLSYDNFFRSKGLNLDMPKADRITALKRLPKVFGFEFTKEAIKAFRGRRPSKQDVD